MRKLDTLTILLVLLALLLTGCGSILEGASAGASDDETDDWPKWSGDSQERNERFTLNYDPVRKPGPWMFIVDQIWLDVQTCVGIAAPDPRLIIEYVPLSKMPITEAGIQVGAYITYKKRYVRVQEDDLGIDSNFLRHELVHYLLWYAGSSSHDLSTHNSQFYEDCLI